MKFAALTLISLTLALGLTLSNVGAAMEGIESHGGGTDQPLTNGPAWFMGKDRVVKACVEVAPGFRLLPDLRPRAGEPTGPSMLDMKSAIRLVQAAHDQWFAYMKDRGIYPAAHDAKDFEFASKMEVHAGCFGAEDLSIYFGVQAPVVKAAKPRFPEPFAFAYSVEKPGHWNPGIIWIAPPGPVGDNKQAIWTYRRLSGELLHELGHTLGNGHVKGTVMDPDNLTFIFNMKPVEYFGPEYVVDQIDQSRELIWGTGTKTFSRVIDWGKDARDDELDLYAFAQVMGRPHKGLLRFTAVVATKDWNKLGGTLHLEDDAGAKDLSLEANSFELCDWIGDSVFEHSSLNALPPEFVMGSGSRTCSLMGTLTDKSSGKVFPIAISQNSNISHFLIELTNIDTGSPLDSRLFDYDTPEKTECAPNPACNLITEPKP